MYVTPEDNLRRNRKAARHPAQDMGTEIRLDEVC